jgi:uncharacterized protein (TIGR03083 family)
MSEIDIGLQYAACRERIAALVADLSPEQTRTPVPACPGWNVHDLVAHLSGSVADVLGGRMDGIGSEAWTAAQVESHEDRSISEMVAQWSEISPQFEDGLRAIGGSMAALGVADAWHHEQDLRGALGVEGGHDPVAEHNAIEAYAPQAGAGWATEGRGPLRIIAGDTTVQSAEGEPGATVTGPPYELARALGGRRTEAQLRALDWHGDAEPYIATLAAMGPAEPLPR